MGKVARLAVFILNEFFIHDPNNVFQIFGICHPAGNLFVTSTVLACNSILPE